MPEGARVSFDDVNNHLGNRLLMVLFSYGASKDILSLNGYEVLRFLEEIQAGRFSDMALNAENRMEYRNVENHVIRYFHNFLASAKTLIDHTRCLMKLEVISAEHFAAYQREVVSLFSDDLSKFVGDLRNYIVHRGLPAILHAYSLADDKWSVGLDLQETRNWEKWSMQSKRFMEDNPQRIHLAWLIATYQMKVMSLHEWFVGSFATYYGDVIREFDGLRAAFLSETR